MKKRGDRLPNNGVMRPALAEQVKEYKRGFVVLRGWRIHVDERSNDHKAKVFVDTARRSAIICGWHNGNPMPSDYALHEVLHVVFAALRATRGRAARREMEEETVRILCALVRGDGPRFHEGAVR